ncbi:MAG: transporter [Desulfuromonadaceae bacterium]|nr:transporter [Desulfuromonadaceae bacterium]
MMNSPVFSAVAVFVLITFLSGASWGVELSEKQSTASISVGGEFSSGSYNTASTTRSFYLPLIASWYPTDRLDTSVELPFLYQSSSEITTSIYQTPTAMTSSQSTARRGGTGGQSGSVGTSGTSGTSGTGSSAVSGLGDIVLRAGYILTFEGDALPQLRTSLFVKAPTASVSDGLGTGEFDLGGGLDLSKWFGDMYLAGEAIYCYQGKVAGFGLRDYLSYSGTVGYQVTHGILPMLVVKGATAPSDYSDNLLEIRGRLLLSLTPSTAMDLFVSRGISNSSPDFAGGVAVVYSF